MTELHPHPVPPRTPSLHSQRQRLLVGCAFGAMLAWNALGEKVSAQAFQLNDANPTLVAGNVDFSRDVVSTPGTETITVNSPTAIINWNRAEADFLPEGNVATFQNGAGLTDFAVLNRISSLDGGAVAFNGTVRSQINGNPGGTLLFQSAGGIIVGATALFDVGNLVLTTLQVGTVDESGYGPYFNPADLRLCCANSPYNQAIITEPGSQIRAANEGSFVVLAAPRVIHGGNTYVNGSSLYFGGEGVSYTINNGLFDIVIDAGSDGNLNPIVHTGTTTGPASTGPNDPHAIYMVASPFSSGDAITMLVGGQVGFEGAAVDNGEIVISAGFDIEAGQIVDDIDRNGFGKYAESSIRITGGTFTSNVTGRATQDAIAVSDDGALSFSGDLNLVAYNEARLSATDGNVNVAGAVGLTSLGALEFGYGSSALAIGPLALDVTGSDVSITAENGNSVVIAGDATLEASAVGDFDDVDDLDAGFGRGGSTRVEVDSTGGQITFQADLVMNATGTGAADARTADTGGDGFGGSATIRALAGEVVVDGGVAIDLRGTGTGGATSAGQGLGGGASIGAAGGNVRIAGATTIDTRGTGGVILGTPAGGTVGGEGRGGFVSISADGGDEVSFGTSTSIDSRGLGGTGAVGGAGNGGGVSLSTGFGTGGRILAGTTFGVDASGTGGAGLGGDGGVGTGGFVGFTASATGGLIGGSTNVTIASNGTGGVGTVSPAGGPTVGGAGLGGDVSLIAETDSGVIQLGNVSVSSVGTGGAGLDGGAGTGGDVFAGTEVGYGGGGIPSNAAFGNLGFIADGTGGTGSRNGGAGTGGSALVGAQAGQVSFGGASNLSARGTGGAAGSQAGGAGQGGSVGIRAFSGQTLLASAGNTVLDASGVGGRGGTGLGTGGNGTGGAASIQAFGGTLTLNGSFALGADGTGGVSSPDIPPVGIGGNGQGGTALIQATPGGQITMGAAALSAVGTGGDGILGGSGTGGRNEITGISGGSVTAGNVTAAADGIGGDGGDTQNGGIGTGGLVRLAAEADGGAIALGDVTATARGTGGEADGSGAGGVGTGGQLLAGTELGYGGSGAPASATFGNVSLDGSGTGGAGNSGGAGNGGIARIEAQAGAISFGGGSSLLARGTGGAASSLAGGTGQGGSAFVRAGPGQTILASTGNSVFDASGVGGDGGTGGDGTGGFATIEAGGAITLNGGVLLRANGTGGVGDDSVPGNGGDGQGGQAFARASGGEITVGGIGLSATGTGGAGSPGGVGTGGLNEVRAEGAGRVTAGNVSADVDGVGGDGLGAQNGGSGTGGIVRLVALADGSSITLGDVTASAQGAGGDGSAAGAAGSGGDIIAGTELGYGAGAASATFGDLFFDTSGTGGAGATGIGGTGTGGLSFAFAPIGSITVGGGSALVADGTGGAGATAGGGGIGGQANFRVEGGATGNATAGAMRVSAAGRGGAGTAGGTGSGGIARTGGDNGQLTLTGGVALDASGFGGAGTSGAGGAGTGGLTELYAVNGANVTFGSASLAADGTGGTGATGGAGTGGQESDPFAPPTGGAAVSVAGGSLTGGGVTQSARGIGGAGGAGAGGAGVGGNVRLQSLNRPAGSLLDIASASMDASASGGQGTGGAGGGATGGTIAAFAQTLNGVIRVDSVSASANATGGAGVSGGDALGGEAQVGTVSGNETGGTVVGAGEFGTVSITASAVGGAATSGAGGEGAGGNAILLGRGSTFTADSATVVANGSGGNSANGVGGEGSGGLALALLTQRFQTGEPIDATIGALSLTSVGTAGTGATTGISRHGLAELTVEGGTARFGSIGISVEGDQSPLNSDLEGPAAIRSIDSDVTVTGSIDIASTSGAAVVADGGTIDLAGAAAISTPQQIALSAIGAGSISGGDWNINAPDISFAHESGAGGSTLDVDSLVAVGQNIDVGSGAVVRANETIGFNAQSVGISGLVAAPDIFISGTFIDITEEGFIGDSSTLETTLDIQPDSGGGPFTIGGENDDYTLDSDELGRIRTRSLEISVPSAPLNSERPYDLVIRDVTFTTPTPTGSGGAINNLLITLQGGEGNAFGVVQVEGALRLENAGVNDGIAIVAPGRVQIINPQGSIRVLGANGLPGGTLGIASANIWSATQSIIDQLVANPNFAGRNEALRTNSGATAERGYIEGGEILLRVGDTLLVQNSGTADTFAGITVVQNTLTVQPTSTDPVDVYAFGRRINADGSFVTNSPYFREVEFGYGSGYLASAEFNLCVIATGVCPDDAPPEPPPPPEFPAGAEVVEGPVEETEESVPPPNPDRQEFVDVSFATESLLEEPVTSGGDSGVWDGEDGDCPPGEVCEPGSGGNP